jgi:uncharacterized caspase-like protein
MLTSLIARIFAIAAFFAASQGIASAEKRVALVIGNATYARVEALTNTINDAADMSGALKRLGFKVTLLNNVSHDQMRRGLRDFSREAVGSDIAMVFFAGHGIEMGGENFLIPIDAELARDTEVEHEAISLKSVMATVEGAKRLGLVVLDACRNNPFAAKMARSGAASRSIGRGLARVEPASSVLVAFAAKEGTTAADGTGRNSPYTASLLKHLETADLEINFLFRNVRDDVVAATGRGQEPFVYGSLSREAIFLKRGPVVASNPGQPSQPIQPVKPAVPLFSGDPGLACDKAATYQHDTRRNPNAAPVANGLIDGPLAIEACRAAIAKYPDEPRYEFQLARGFFVLQNVDQTIEFASRAARRGYGSAACTLGLMHTQSALIRGVNEYAVRWYEIGIRLGEYECANNLAFHYLNGLGVARNTSRAAALLKIAADRGYDLSQVTLGKLMIAGEGVAKDVPGGQKLLEAAAKAGNGEAMSLLAESLRRTAPREIGRSTRLLLDAFKRGDALARVALTEKFATMIDAEWRKAIEAELARAGFLRRPANGSFDTATQDALQAFLVRN